MVIVGGKWLFLHSLFKRRDARVAEEARLESV